MKKQIIWDRNEIEEQELIEKTGIYYEKEEHEGKITAPENK